jgi:uncharacterized protein (TIGR02466 family)
MYYKKDFMNIENIAVFPTLITKVSRFLTEEQCKDIFNYSKSKKLLSHGALTNGSVSSHSIQNNILQEIIKDIPNCALLTEQLYSVIQNYKNHSGISANVITNSWINFQNIGSKLLRHAHGGSSISGAIYLNVDEKSSSIFFYNPNPFIKITEIEKDHNTLFTSHSQSVKPTNGDLIIFPSWLEHGSDEDVNQTVNRAVLSFNVA